MTRMRVAAIVAMLLCLLALPAVASADKAESQVIAKVNSFRRHHHERPLIVSSSLMHSAEAYSSYMMAHSYFGHLSRIRASSQFHTLGEIIEYHSGTHADPGWAFSGWSHSPEHIQVMLYSSFRYVGAGYSTGRFDGHKATIWVMHFGAH
jgi:uncharacterized protein YkwD